MNRASSRTIPSFSLGAAASFLAAATFAGSAAAQTPTMKELLDRIDAQDKRIEQLTNGAAAGFSSGYRRGFFIRSSDPNSPFHLRINGRMQFRYVGFASDSDAAVVNPDRNDFEIERARLEFRGTFFDPDTHFYINLDADTDENHRVIFHDFWVNHDLGENHSLYVGKAFFPGSRDWMNGSTTTHLIDRSMATTFFRPDRSIGVWLIGKMCGDIHYRIAVMNGLKTTDLAPDSVDGNLAYGASFWRDFGASYGKGYADLQQHEEAAVRIGSSFSYAQQDEVQGQANAEAGVVRLSDGSKLNQSGMGVEDFTFALAAADAAFKFHGFALHGEAFFRQLSDIRSGTMPAIRDGYYDWGGYCDAGYMIVPQRFEVVARASTVQGALGDSNEYAAGVNWYVAGTHENKLSFDVTKLDGSPTSNSSPNFRVGDEGLMIRFQWQIAF